jgi:hypothetical protein
LAARLSVLIKELRRNGVLLVHARDCLRDVLSASQGRPPTVSPLATHSTAPPPTLLSLRG